MMIMNKGVEDMRHEHPFHMVDSILQEPDAVLTVVANNKGLIRNVAARMKTVKRIFLVGIGTSYHAAQVGQYCSIATGCEIPTYCVHSFDFANYTPNLNEHDCVIGISHRGTKTYTVEALKQASAAGCFTVRLTGTTDATLEINDSVAMIQTVAQELSSAHTISYLASLTILAALFTEIAGNVLEQAFLREQLPAVLRETLEIGLQAMGYARNFLQKRRIWIIGGGPSAVTASEIALKIKETSYLQAEGMSIEAMLHGPFQCIDPEDGFIVIAPQGKAQGRVLTIVPMIQAIGAEFLLVDDGTTSVVTNNHITVPEVPEHFSAFTCVIPLQLLTYQLALMIGTNPDGFRLEDARFNQAATMVQL